MAQIRTPNRLKPRVRSRSNIVVRLQNISKQMVPLQVRTPGGDFYLHEQQVRLAPGSTVSLPKDHLMADQLKNLAAKRIIKVLFDGEATAGS